MRYVDFTIRARDWEDGHFKVEVTQSPLDRMREAELVSQPPNLARYLRNLERKRISTTDLRTLGTQLADMLLPPAVREMLFASMATLDPESGLRLRLVLDDLRVANLPWEYLYLSPLRAEDTPYGFLALDARISIVRHEAIPIAPGSVGARLPLKLVVGFASPAQYPRLDLTTERAYIAQALDGVASVQVTFVEHLTATRLEASCQGAHMFHFAGHAGFMWQDSGRTTGYGAIFLEDEQGELSPMPVEQLAQTLRRCGVRVVFLGGCETGRRDGVNAWSGVAPALMRVGIPAAVAMQYAIYDEAAVAFARRFYAALSVGLSLDEAVTAGRLAILGRGNEADVEWGVPVLYMRSGDGVIFPEMAADPSLEAFRHAQRIRISQQVRELRDRLTGVEIGQAPHTAMEVAQEIGSVAPGGEALGARIESLAAGVIHAIQKVEHIGPGGRLTGIRLCRTEGQAAQPKANVPRRET
ncbi:MAG: CHAT domain-containing protein [Anaerolineae bacterium]|nr:CHAT domain-containing protein [Anaerolineae bacterium]